eukprot:37350-Amphidinium_carterae.1
MEVAMWFRLLVIFMGMHHIASKKSADPPQGQGKENPGATAIVSGRVIRAGRTPMSIAVLIGRQLALSAHKVRVLLGAMVIALGVAQPA